MKIFMSTCLLIFCFVLLSSNKIIAQAKADEILKLDNPFTSSFITKNISKESPKLILTPAIEKNLKQKINDDPLFQAYHQHLQNLSEQILQEPLLKRELEGSRMLAVSRKMVERMGVLGLIYRLDKDPLILGRINDELLAVCQFEDWNPIHYLDVAEMSFAVSIAIDWVGEYLPKVTVDIAKTSLIDKGILPSYNEDGQRMGWVNGKNNWNTICHSGMIAASLAIADINPELAAKTISRGLDKIVGSLKEYGPDGVYPEGPSYWAYGTSYGVWASNMLTTSFGNDFGISASPGFIESATFRLAATAPSGQYFNFADSDGSHNGSGAALLAWFAFMTGDALYYDKAFLDDPTTVGSKFIAPGIIWMAQFLEKKTSKIPSTWIGKGANPVAIFHGDQNDEHQFYLAAKGGKAQISHGNMDAGSFVFDLNGVRWALDPGNQRYYSLNKIGFQLSNYNQNSERWSLLTKGNFTHNTITVNDERFAVKGFAPIIDFENGKKAKATIDLTELYSGNITSLHRKFSKESNQSILIEDLFEVNEKTNSLTWSMMTISEVIPTKTGAILKQDGKELEFTILSPHNLKLSIISLDPPPLEIDKTIKGLKRIEIRVPAHIIKEGKGNITVRLSGKI